MLKWIFILILVVGAFLAVRNWSTIMAKWNTGISQIPGISHLPTFVQQPDNPGVPDEPESSKNFFKNVAPAPVGAWEHHTVGGITLDLPFNVTTYTPTHPSPAHPNIVAEYYRGGGQSRALFIKHETNTTMAGEIMLAWANRSIDSEAKRLKMDLMSRNPATTVINGYRARRIDMISQSSTPRLRARFVSLERGNQAWLVQLTTLENDTEAEQMYQRIANSAR